MSNDKVAFLPFHAINQFMRDDYRQVVVQSVLTEASKLPERHRKEIQNLTRKHIQVPGFRNSSLAPAGIKLRPAIAAFEKRPDVVAGFLSAWVEMHPDLRQNVFDLLSGRNWEILPPEADRTHLPGFLTSWPEGEDFDIINKAFQDAYPESQASSDDISLMVVWLAGRLPYSGSEE